MTYFICCVATLPMAVSPQLITLTSTVSREEIVCPGEEVIFTCITRESAIIIWMSTTMSYIGDQIEFTTENMVNETRRSSIDSNTVATLVKNIIENGTQVLESQLQIVMSSVSLNPSITCIHGSNNIPVTSIFHVLGELQECNINVKDRSG